MDLSIILLTTDDRHDRHRDFNEQYKFLKNNSHGVNIKKFLKIDGLVSSKYGLEFKEHGIAGCTVNHMFILNNMENLCDTDYCLVLEDDVVFCPDFFSRLHKFIANLPSDFVLGPIGCWMWGSDKEKLWKDIESSLKKVNEFVDVLEKDKWTCAHAILYKVKEVKNFMKSYDYLFKHNVIDGVINKIDTYTPGIALWEGAKPMMLIRSLDEFSSNHGFCWQSASPSDLHIGREVQKEYENKFETIDYMKAGLKSKKIDEDTRKKARDTIVSTRNKLFDNSLQCYKKGDKETGIKSCDALIREYDKSEVTRYNLDDVFYNLSWYAYSIEDLFEVTELGSIGVSLVTNLNLKYNLKNWTSCTQPVTINGKTIAFVKRDINTHECLSLCRVVETVNDFVIGYSKPFLINGRKSTSILSATTVNNTLIVLTTEGKLLKLKEKNVF